MKMLIQVSILVILSSCASPAKEPERLQTISFSTISVAAKSFKPTTGESIAWYGDLLWSDTEMENNHDIVSLQLTTAINKELTSRGYRIVNQRNEADYILGAAVITPTTPKNENLTQFFRLFPGLRESSMGFEKGAIVAAIVEADRVFPNGTLPDQRSVLWRSALEAFILGDQISAEQRAARIQNISSLLINSIPDIRQQ